MECDLESIENALFIRRAVPEGEEAAVEISDQNFPGVDGGSPEKKNRPGKGGKVTPELNPSPRETFFRSGIWWGHVPVDVTEREPAAPTQES